MGLTITPEEFQSGLRVIQQMLEQKFEQRFDELKKAIQQQNPTLDYVSVKYFSSKVLKAPSTVRDMCAKGQLKHRQDKPGGKIEIHASEIERLQKLYNIQSEKNHFNSIKRVRKPKENTL